MDVLADEADDRQGSRGGGEAKKKKVFTPEQELDAKEGKLPTIAWTTFPSWEAVGAWYRGLEGDRMVASAEVKAKVAEVTAGKTTEEEKVRAVYGYVATQVRYIGVAFGLGDISRTVLRRCWRISMAIARTNTPCWLRCWERWE